MNRSNAPAVLQGPDATPDFPNVNETYVPITPSRTIITPKEIIATPCNKEEISSEEHINEYHPPYEDSGGNPVYWFNYHVKNTEYPLVMCEIQHFKKIKIGHDQSTKN